MSSTPQPEALPLARLLSKPVLISGAAVCLGLMLAWFWLAFTPIPGSSWHGGPAMQDMPGMGDMTEATAVWSVGYILPAFSMWALMMVAMMLPSATPMILLHARIDRGTTAQRTSNSLLFVLSYLAVWSAFSVLAALAQAALIDRGVVAASSLAIGNRSLIAALLIVTAIWQLTGVKAACLAQCQSPLQFVMRFWHPGAAGAVRLGLRHGIFCIGCCWSLMLLLFVSGVMNLAWIATLSLLVFLEKVAPVRWRADRWLALVLMAGAVVSIVV